MKLLPRLATVLALGGAAAAITTVPAHADNGDGNVACNTGEICFHYDYSLGNLRRHFYNGDMQHNDDYYWDPANNRQSSIKLMDTAGSFWNRDTECAIKIWDITSTGGWFVTFTAPRGWKGDLRTVGKQNRNNGHSRC